MAGLKIDIGGGKAIGSSTRLNQAGGATVAQVAYGGGAAPGSQGRSGVQYHHTFIGVVAGALLFETFLYHSLPSGMKNTFHLVLLEVGGILPIYAGAGILSRKQLQFGKPQGVAHGTARLVKALTP